MRSVKLFAPVVLAVLMVTGAAFGQNNVTITSATGAQGSEVSVEINVTSDQDVLGFQATLSFDQNALQLLPMSSDGISLGSDADSLSLSDVTEARVTEANSNGSVTISVVSFTDGTFIASGSDRNVVDIKFMIAEGASLGDVDLALSDVSLSNDQGADITIASTTDGTITVTSGVTEGNRIWVEDATGAAGGNSTVTVKLTSDTNVHALSFDLMFDQSSLQVRPLSANSVVVGDDASGLEIPILDDELIASANSSGKLSIYMFHLNVDPNTDLNSISAGMDKEVLEVKFAVDANAAVGDLALDLANVSVANIVQDTVTQEIEVTAESGALTISEFQTGDASGDGVVNIFDVLAVLGALKGNPTTGPADVNGDGKVNIFDVLEVLKLLKN